MVLSMQFSSLSPFNIAEKAFSRAGNEIRHHASWVGILVQERLGWMDIVLNYPQNMKTTKQDN